MQIRRTTAIYFIIILSFIAAAYQSCSTSADQDVTAEVVVSGTLEGRNLAMNFCSSCHLFVPAGKITRDVWKRKVLPAMAPKLGIGVFGEDDYINSTKTSGLIKFDEWMQIVNYYTLNSPEKLQPADPPSAKISCKSIFAVKKTSRQILPFAKTMLISFDPATRSIFTSDGNTNYLYRWNSDLVVQDSIQVGSAAVSSIFFEDEGGHKGAFAVIGTMTAKENFEGLIFEADIPLNAPAQRDTLMKGLSRPVFIQPADLDHHGSRDWIICNFGHNQGGLYWLKAVGKDSFQKRSILEIPGATQVFVRDVNNDGWDDLLVLFAHAEESIRLFINNRDETFTMSILLSFLPVNGSSSMELADINNDGWEDILYTCGDNADLSPILKPYHGLYIFLNQKNNSYVQSYFYPINGCTKAIAKDFDKDGDLDIATIAFFADFEAHPSEKFLYLEQVSPMDFKPISPPIEKEGRWICMEAADYDNDGDIDILLGNFARGFMNNSITPDWNVSNPFIIMENKTVDNLTKSSSSEKPNANSD